MKLNQLVLTLGLAASLGLTAARAADAPSVDSILQKHIEASGGKAAIEKIKSRTMKFKMESEAMGNSEGEIRAKTPNKQWTQVDLGSNGTITEGFDGTVAWATNPWQGVRVKTGDELAKVKRDADFHRDLRLKSTYPDLAYKGTEKVGEEMAYVLESKPTATSKEKLFFSQKTGLLVRQESEFEGPQGQAIVSILPQEYKEFDGIKYPTVLKLKYSAGGQGFEFTMKVTEVKHGAEIEDKIFAKPSA